MWKRTIEIPHEASRRYIERYDFYTTGSYVFYAPFHTPFYQNICISIQISLKLISMSLIIIISWGYHYLWVETRPPGPKVLNGDLSGVINGKHRNEICNNIQLGKSLPVSRILSRITGHLRATRYVWTFKSLQILNSCNRNFMWQN